MNTATKAERAALAARARAMIESGKTHWEVKQALRAEGYSLDRARTAVAGAMRSIRADERNAKA